MLIEGRDRVRDLRAPTGRPLEIVLREVAADQPFARQTTVEVLSEGTPRAVKPLALDEIVRIAGEALFNAARHAQADHLLVRIAYERRCLRISFRDDGVGISAESLVRAGREGHFGLIGMHERARRIGAQFAIDSAAGRGTTVSLRLPSSLAYSGGERRRARFASPVVIAGPSPG